MLKKNCHPSIQAFSFLELLVVITIIAIIASIGIAAFRTSGLTVATRKVSNLMTLARAEAISKHTITRVVVLTESESRPEARYQSLSLWRYDKHADENKFKQLSKWEDLPKNVVIEPLRPTYLSNAEYAQKDPTTIRSDYFVDKEAFPSWELPDGQKVQYVEFTPSGSARLEDGKNRNIMIVLAEGWFTDESREEIEYARPNEDGSNANWSQVITDTLTGRIKVYYP